MSRVSIYVFISASDKDAAVSRVQSFLEESCGREFFDGFEAVEDDVILASGLTPDYIRKGDEAAADLLQHHRKRAAECAEAGDKHGEGYALMSAGEILAEHLCSDMPWFNLDYWDWTVPCESHAPAEPGHNWYAVMVEFHY